MDDEDVLGCCICRSKQSYREIEAKWQQSDNLHTAEALSSITIPRKYGSIKVIN
jgi:hypothetical protein